MIAGTDQISTYKEGAEQYDVTCNCFRTAENPLILARLMVPSTQAGQVRLDSIATIRRGTAPRELIAINAPMSAWSPIKRPTCLDVAVSHRQRREEGPAPRLQREIYGTAKN